MHYLLIKTRKIAILIHRWMGIAFCIPFLMWFLSGIVMMYTDYPVLNDDARVAHLPAINFDAVKTSAQNALITAAVSTPEQLTLSSIGSRPVYRIRTKSTIRTIFADSGLPLSLLEEREAREIASIWTGLPLQEAALQGLLTQEDQWTVTSKYRPYRPLWKYAWPNGEVVYVSSITGEIVQHTDRRSRMGAYFGAIPHWIYITQLRRDAALWNKVVIWISALGSVMTIFGLIAGIWLYSPRSRYRYEGAPSRVPFMGSKRWHVIAGLSFGFLTFTWILSGMFSMSILQSKPNPVVGKSRKATYDPSWNSDEWQLADLHVLHARDIREVEFVHSLGQPAYLTYDKHGTAKLLSIDGTQTAPTTAQIESAFSSAIKPAHVVASRIVTEYELYYVDRRHKKPLPALYLETNDSNTSAFYLDLATGRIVQTYGTAARWNRWLYHGLHSWDLPWFYRHRPLWDALMIMAMLAGIALSWTGVWIAALRLRSKIRQTRRRSVRTT